MRDERENDLTGYEDMLDMPHPVSKKRKRMSAFERAAQFSPFAALTGYEDILEETGRLTEVRLELTEEEKERIGGKLYELNERIEERPLVKVSYFLKDERKEGGSHLVKKGRLLKIDPERRCLIFEDGTRIFIPDITEIEG